MTDSQLHTLLLRAATDLGWLLPETVEGAVAEELRQRLEAEYESNNAGRPVLRCLVCGVKAAMLAPNSRCIMECAVCRTPFSPPPSYY